MYFRLPFLDRTGDDAAGVLVVDDEPMWIEQAAAVAPEYQPEFLRKTR